MYCYVSAPLPTLEYVPSSYTSLLCFPLNFVCKLEDEDIIGILEGWKVVMVKDTFFLNRKVNNY